MIALQIISQCGWVGDTMVVSKNHDTCTLYIKNRRNFSSDIQSLWRQVYFTCKIYTLLFPDYWHLHLYLHQYNAYTFI